MRGDFGGSEPLVGEIVGLRTFRVDDSGLLLPLYSHEAWYDGTNVATCSPPTGDRVALGHTAPDDDCECGFYAYSGVEAAGRNRHTRYVQAVVSCWGRVVAGTHGVRAQYARIDAIWIAPSAPAWLRHRVALRYPSARLYADAGAMLAEHPLTALECYEPAHRPAGFARVLTAVTAALVVLLGALPMPVLRSHWVLFDGWLAAVAVGCLAVGWLLFAARGVGRRAAAIVVLGALMWLLAPPLGLAGWLLRLPLLRALGGGAVLVLVRLRPRHFPVVRTVRPPAAAALRA